jgi:hypothetical protein
MSKQDAGRAKRIIQSYLKEISAKNREHSDAKRAGFQGENEGKSGGE